MTKRLHNLMVGEVSLVDHAATGEVFALTKAASPGTASEEEETMLTAEDIKKAVTDAVEASVAPLVAKAASSDAALAVVTEKLEDVTKAFDTHKILMAEAAEAAKAQVDAVAKLAQAGAEWGDIWDAKDKVYSFLNKLTDYAEVAGAGNTMEGVAKAAPPEREDTLAGVAKALVDVAVKAEALEAVVKAATEAKTASDVKVVELEAQVAKAATDKAELEAKVATLESAPISKALGSDPTPEDIKKSNIWGGVINLGAR